MDLRNSTFLHSLLIFMCIRCVHNRRKPRNFNWFPYSNPDVFLNSQQLIEKYGYPFEKHSAITEDGYEVNLFRIPKDGRPVLLAHGIGDTSDCWLVLGPTNSLAYLLADAGFDVWLYNARGNKYSKRHTRNLSSKEYWNFSYEEMGSQDLPAVIDYILRLSFHPKLSFIGFSQGTTIFFVMCSLRPEYSKKVNHAILLAPVAWVGGLKYPFIDIITPNLEQISKLADIAGLHELFSSSPLISAYHANVCNMTSSAKILCELEFYISYGVRNISYLPADRLPVIASHIPAGASAKTFLHFMQGYVSKRFQRYNYYGAGKNDFVYGSPEPPSYNIRLVHTPLTLFASETDWYSTSDDVRKLTNALPNIVNFVMFNKSLDFTHLEFVYGARVKTLVNDPVVSLLLLIK